MALVCEYHEELENDLLKQDVDLLDLWRGRITFRRLATLIRHLPDDSLLIRAADPDRALLSSWGPAEYQRAMLLDLFGKANFQNWKPVPRPADVLNSREADAARDRRRQIMVERTIARMKGD